MTDSIYTIPAREVVPGMLVAFVDTGRPMSWVRKTVWLVRPHSHIVDRVEIFLVDGQPDSLCPGSAEEIDVYLPGPSPRELLCSCKSAPCIREPVCGGCRDYRTGNHERHDIDCPVHRLRLRLWPVGATWDGEAWCHVALGWRVFPADLLPADVDAPLNLDEIRAAFCEPEVTP
jgi:hypothetical protein